MTANELTKQKQEATYELIRNLIKDKEITPSTAIKIVDAYGEYITSILDEILEKD